MANENITTSTDIKVFIAGESTAKTKAEFEALTWTEIGGISDIEPFGDEAQEVTGEVYGAGRVIKRPGVRNAGNLGLKVYRDTFDAGQVLLRSGFDGRKPNAFKVQLPDRPTGAQNGTPTFIYALGVILSAKNEPGSANDFLKQNFNVSLTDKPLEVPATVGA